MGRKARHKRERRALGQGQPISERRSERMTPEDVGAILGGVVARGGGDRMEDDGIPLAFFSDGKGPMMVIEQDGRVAPARRNDDGQSERNAEG
jgi:hypothetical protein